ncbi:MAG: hypothetical protein V3V10_01310 [Planctomycetota bacterium]
MPINLRYGQQAVARGFVSSQRLEQILAKQRQLKEQGKTISVRMILEKAKLLDAGQLQQIDQDLNIKVVKKKAGKLQRPGVPATPAAPEAPTGAQDFAGEAPPQFGGMDGADADATLFSPPPPDMQQRVSAEREAAQTQQGSAQEAEVQGFLNEDSASPFGGDPFGGDAFGGDQGAAPMKPMAPEMQPMGAEMQPMAEDPFAAEMQPMQAEYPFAAESPMQPMAAEMQPMAEDPFGAEMQPMGMDAEPFGAAENIDSTAQYPMPDAAPAELDRLGSSPKLASLAAEFDGFNTGEDEELPIVEAGFDQMEPQAIPMAGTMPIGGPELAPVDGEFDSMSEDLPVASGNTDFMSPEQMEATPAKPPAPVANMDATMFSPPPPGFKDAAMAAAEPEPAGDDWGEDHPVVAAFDDAEDMNATVFSPPPPGIQGGTGGRQGADDFGDIDIPAAGAPVNDVPTAPAAGDPVHPIRRGVSTSSANQDKQRPPTSSQVQIPADEEVSDELPESEPVMGKPKLPDGKGLLGKKSGPSSKPMAAVPTGDDEVLEGEEGKKEGKKGLLVMMLLLLLVLAALIIPIALPGKIHPAVDEFRNGTGKPLYDKVQKIYDKYSTKEAPKVDENVPDKKDGKTEEDTTE